MEGKGDSKHTFGLVGGVSQGKFLKILLLEMMHVKRLYNQALGRLFSEFGSQTCSILITWELVRNANPSPPTPMLFLDQFWKVRNSDGMELNKLQVILMED